MSAYIWGSEVPPMVVTSILVEGHRTFGIQYGLCYFPYAHLDPVLAIRALNNPFQDCSSEAQEYGGRASGRQTTLTRWMNLLYSLGVSYLLVCFHFKRPSCMSLFLLLF